MAVIKLKTEMLEILQGELSAVAFAEAVGVDYVHLWRIRTGASNPGEEFIAKMLVAFPRRKFEELFYVEK